MGRRERWHPFFYSVIIFYKSLRLERASFTNNLLRSKRIEPILILVTFLPIAKLSSCRFRKL